MRSFLADCWPLVAAFALATLVTVCCGADQKPLVINPTTGKTEQMQTGNNLLIPGATASTSPTTGSLVNAGGFGNVGRAFLGTIGTTFKGNVDAGVQDGTAAVAGQVGETITANAASTAVAATGTVGNVTSISVTRGAWLITGSYTINEGATGLTAGSTVNCSIVTTSATNGTQGTTMQQHSSALTANGFVAMASPTQVINITATTTYYLTEQCTFAAGSPTVSGQITAVRIR